MANVAMVVTNACAPDPRVERHAKWLTESGHQVTIHAWDRLCIHPENELRNGYRIKRYQHGKTNFSAPIKTWFRKKKFLRKIKIDADIIILNDSDTMGVKSSGPTILDVHDLAHTWPLMRGNSLMHKAASWAMLKQAKKAILSSNEVIVSAPDFQHWVSDFNRDSTVVMNKRNTINIQNTKDKVLGYFGRIREFESINHAYNAAKTAGFRMVVAGDGIDVEKMLLELPQIDYRGPFTEEELTDLMSEISVMYAMYNPKRANISNGAIPTKMLDAAAHGVPSVVNSESPMGEYCVAEKLGTTAKYGDNESIAKAIQAAYGIKITDYNTDDKESFMKVVEKILN
ncbi:MAG: glycosyltransferase [Candidatus Poseidoniales archaeon]|nr:glycosyltransferase [Candidatus Poseidoniales archaeon]